MNTNNPFQILFDFFEQFIPLDESEKSLIEQYFKLRKFQKKQFILQENDTCKHYSFVIEGCLRMYKTNAQGNENITQFFVEKDWIINYDSFYHLRSSIVNIDVLQSVILLQISHNDLAQLLSKKPKFETIFRQIDLHNATLLQKHICHISGLPSPERYLYFEQEFPYLLGRISQVQIASFLGITPECISRIKNVKAKKS